MYVITNSKAQNTQDGDGISLKLSGGFDKSTETLIVHRGGATPAHLDRILPIGGVPTNHLPTLPHVPADRPLLKCMCVTVVRYGKTG